MKAILALLKKEFLLDYRDKKAWSGVALYVLSTAYLVYLAMGEIVERETWNGLFWIVMLFTGFNVVARTYDQDRDGRSIYLYTLAGPAHVILAKTIYTAAFMMIVSSIAWLAFYLFAPMPSGPEYSSGLFLSALMLGGVGITTTLGLVSAIAWKSGANSGMIAILGFPVIIPLLMAIISYSQGILSGFSWAFLSSTAYSLVALILIGTSLGYILFPYIWKE